MKSIYIMLFISITLLSCEDYLEFLKENDNPPTVLIVKDNGQEVNFLKDTLKLPSSIKDDRDNFYRINVKGFDPESGLTKLDAKIISGQGTLTQNNKSEFNFDENGNAELIYTPSSNLLATHVIEITATDNLGNIGSTRIELLVIVNLLPVASFKLTELGVNHPFEFLLDATASFDQDANKGGQIVALEWNINGATIIDPLNNENGVFDGLRVTRFIFPGTGTYEIRLVAVDNDGGKSAEISIVRTLN